MSNDTNTAPCALTRILAVGLALSLPCVATAQETAEASGAPSQAEIFLAANFMGLPLPDLFAEASGTLEPAMADAAGHEERAVFSSVSFDTWAAVETDIFDDPLNAQAAFEAWTADAATDIGLVYAESTWVSLEDPSTSIRCWHVPANPSFPPDWVECRSWTDGRPQVIGILIEGATLDSLEAVQGLLRQGHDMLRISWFTVEETAL